MAVKDELHDLVNRLIEVDAEEALRYLNWLATDGETLTASELGAIRRGEEQIARGSYASLDDLRRV